MESCKELPTCLCCNGENLRTILDLGNQSPANNYNVTEAFPLKLNVCLSCSHAQLSHSVNPDILFKDYPYMSGVSETMRNYYEQFAASVQPIKFKTIYEIACNDGAQLDEFKKLGWETCGIDPAENLYSETRTRGHDITCGYFPEDAPDKTFDVIVAQNVLAHNPYPYEFLMGCKKMMREDSVLYIQTSQANMIQNHQFDTIYHEHISFFNARSIHKLLDRCDLQVVRRSFLPDIHGGSDLYVLKKMPEISVLNYSDFSNRSYKFAENFRNRVEDIQKGGKRVICYGAAAKMINLIRFTGIKPNKLIDDTPTKIGKYIDGLQVSSSAYLGAVDIEGDTIIPVWNFYNEIKNKVESQYPGKFKFLMYIPIIE